MSTRDRRSLVYSIYFYCTPSSVQRPRACVVRRSHVPKETSGRHALRGLFRVYRGMRVNAQAARGEKIFRERNKMHGRT